MLSKANKKILIAIVNIGSYFWVSPISCHTSSGGRTTFIVIEKNYKRFQFLLLIWCLNMIYLMGRLLHLIYHIKPAEFSEFQPFWKLFFVCIAMGSITIILTALGTNRYTIATFTNDWIGLLEYFAARYYPSWTSNISNSCDRVMKCFLIFGIVIPIGNVMDYLLNPFDIIYASSLLKDHYFLFIVTYIPFGVVMYYIHIMAAVPGLIVMSTCVLSTVIAGLQIFPEMKPNARNARYHTIAALREPENLLSIYRSLQLIMGKLNENVSMIVMPVYNIQTYCVIISTFAMMRFYKSLHTVIILIICIVSGSMVFQWILILSIAGLMLKKSTSLVDGWRRTPWGEQRDKKFIKRMCKSCKPISLSFGHFYTVKIMRVLMFFNFILWGTLRALLIF